MAEPEPNRIPPDFVRAAFDLTGRVAVVTGAASGLGSAIAQGLAQAGMTLALLDIDEVGLASTALLIREGGGEVSVHTVDVTSRPQLDEVAGQILAAHGRVDVLVNSAGTAFRCPAEDFPEDRYDAILNLNLKGTYLACQVFGRIMLAAGRGSIINLSSIGAEAAYPLASAYQASKGAVKQLTKALALEWRSRGVRVNAIGPTLMDSPLTAAGAATTSETADFISARMIRPRLAAPREIVGAAIFLAADASDIVTGHTIMCDDGYTIA
jgi:NAD(P)-dependent dehydrogenase (short-subunit alcohol dehydrogenase family)